jgi:hypothetical protein
MLRLENLIILCALLAAHFLRANAVVCNFTFTIVFIDEESAGLIGSEKAEEVLDFLQNNASFLGGNVTSFVPAVRLYFNSTTSAPTASPTQHPTNAPTASPTMLPTKSPTQFPSAAPTTSPTQFPSASPTLSPTRLPSTSPTRAPTAAPSGSPTLFPSSSPTASPEKSPTTSPTLFPSEAPSRSPTNSPSQSPTRFPSNAPSRSPSRSPTKSPTLSPSAAPTRSPSTTLFPSKAPTSSPTRAPTKSPSVSPTKAPSVSPTKMPTNAPSAAPTPSPTETYVCPAIGGCTTSAGDAFSTCAPAGNCPAGSVPDTNTSYGSSCIGGNDPSQTFCQCCTRSCGASWASSPCVQAASDYLTCVAAGTCASVFGATPSALSCGAGSCECCDFSGSIAYNVSAQPVPQQINMCVGGSSNNFIQFPETCDGTALNGQTCASLGFHSGTLTCSSFCDSYNTAQCAPFGACCDNSFSMSCSVFQTAASCFGANKIFVPFADSCTENLCAAAFAVPSDVPTAATQASNTVTELGVRIISPTAFFPVTPGGGGGCSSCSFGTAGMLVRSISNSTYYVLTNAHVSALPTGFKLSESCATQSPPDGTLQVAQAGACGATTTANPIGTLSAFTSLTPHSIAKCDAALLNIENVPTNEKPDGTLMGMGLHATGAPVEATLGMSVFKVGGRTGITYGQVVGIDVVVSVTYESNDASQGSFNLRFLEQLLIVGTSGKFSNNGDSGSGIFENSTFAGVGLLFAGNEEITVASPLRHVFDAFFPGNDGELANRDGIVGDQSKRSLRSDDEEQRKIGKGKGKGKGKGNGSARTNRGERAFGFQSRSGERSPLNFKVEQARALRRSALSVTSLLETFQNRSDFVASYVGISKSDPTQPTINLLVSSMSTLDNARASIPASIDSIPIVVEYSIPFEAY